MGCDIHAVFQKRIPTGWEDVTTEWDEDRHYFLFSVLAGVRNGCGFAGTPTYDPIVPISDPRGFPEDFALDGEDHPVATLALMGRRGGYHEAGEPPAIWMGDHSHSWLSADEILSYAKHAQTIRRTGVVSLEAYRAWDKESQPHSWCGGVAGGSTQVNVPSEINESTTHVQISWVRSALDEIAYFLREVQRLKDEHGDVRVVFGFDS